MTTNEAFQIFWSSISKTCDATCLLKIESSREVVDYFSSIDEFYIQNLHGYEVLIFIDPEKRHLNKILAPIKPYEIDFEKRQITLNCMCGTKLLFIFSK